MAGPGHKPPIPHPNPKNMAPPINLISMTLLFGLNNLLLKKGTFLILIMYVKNTKLTAKPQPRTNISEGFQSFPKAKKPITLDLLAIPETNMPTPNIKPTKKTINWSFTKYELEFIL